MEEYYFLSPDNQRMGPFSLDELLRRPINSNTLVWKQGLAQWTPARNIPEVAQQLPPNDAATPPPPFSPHGENRPPCPPTNLVWGILTTVFCCLPLGIVAIFKSSKVERCYYEKDYEGALKASKSAANWSIASLVITLVFWAIYLGFVIVMPLSIAALGM